VVEITKKAEAYRSFADWLDTAERLRKSFQQVGEPLPEKLQSIIGGNGSVLLAPKLPVLRPPAPAEAGPDWVWVEVKKSMAGTLALALVRASSASMTTREIHERVAALGVAAVIGTIANIGTKYEELGIIERKDEGKWILLQPDKAAVLHDDYLWGLPAIFQMQELAANRRNAVVYVLKETPGLQIVQIVSQLRNRQLIHRDIPANKTLIADDLAAMEGTRVRRRGKKWEVVE